MTLAPERPVQLDAPINPPDLPDDEPAGGEPTAPEVRLLPVALSGGLAAAAAAWLSGGLVKGALPPWIALLGVLIGAGTTYLAFRWGRPAVQYAVVPVAALVGAALVAPAADGGTANLPRLVGEVLRGGGLQQPPVPFDPGWRFVLVVLFAVIGAAAVAAGVVTGRPKLAPAVPVPVLAGAALLQPSGSEVVASSVAIVLLLAAVAISFGASLSTEETRELSRGFELRRLLRGLAMLCAVVVGIVLLAQTSFLFPSTQEQRVVPPRRPPNVPLEKDRELFTVAGDLKGPLRVGALDEYDGRGWLLPPEDPTRLVELPDARLRTADLPDELVKGRGTDLRVRITDMTGLVLPVPALLTGFDGNDTVRYDPRVGVLRLESRLPQGYTFTAKAGPAPTAAQLDEADPSPPALREKFTQVPPAPARVIELLAKAPEEPFRRVQYLRDELYKTVELLGGGGPVDVSPLRAGALLEKGAKATPYEVAATEALLARWAGVPARIGYGYFGGEPIDKGLGFRPKHGRAWLETYFEGYGWVPLVGTPPRAAASLSQQAKLQDPSVRPSDDLALVVYVPVRQESVAQLFQVIRYWLLVAVPIAAAGIATYLLYPALCKLVRSGRRRRWAAAHGGLGRVLVTYAELRDRCSDLNLGDVGASPLAFARTFVPDDEHDELAWVVTRIFWGDLRRDLRDADVEAAVEATRSFEDRLMRAQPMANRLAGRLSRASLREPYNAELPNFYPRPGRLLAPLRWALRLLRRGLGRLRPQGMAALLRPGRATAVVLLCALLGGCGGAAADGPPPAEFPESITPTDFLGLRFQREPVAEREFARTGDTSLVEKGHVYTVREGSRVQASLEVAVLERTVDVRDLEAQAEIESGLGGGFRSEYFGPIRIRAASRGGQRVFLWFPPERNVMMLLVVRKEYDQARRLALGTFAHVRGIDLRRLEPVLSLEEP